MTQRDQLREALAAIQQSTRDDEKGEQWTIRNFLNKHGVFNDDISGSRRLVAEACRYVLSTPVEPAGASEPPSEADNSIVSLISAASAASGYLERQQPDLSARLWSAVQLVQKHVQPTHGEPAPCVWRDIASAPKDETPIRLKWAGTTVEAIGRWCPAQVLPSGFGRSNYSDDWRDVEGDDVLLLPTHWKPVIVSGSPLKVER